MMCKYYSFSEKAVGAMTLEKFNNMIKQAEIISKMEYSEEEKEVSLTGEQGAVLAKRMFPRGKL